jgi:hypothetical protein
LRIKEDAGGPESIKRQGKGGEEDECEFGGQRQLDRTEVKSRTSVNFAKWSSTKRKRKGLMIE